MNSCYRDIYRQELLLIVLFMIVLKVSIGVHHGDHHAKEVFVKSILQSKIQILKKYLNTNTHVYGPSLVT